ncbi:fungal-specific transcription factor domain-containing protein [Apodospora peruviana]|uniref:Fungal-specific transcription factor domain-containing protein n=1 Tax=Apodospora peruviana TaxID=516989 RepID=A0AAE0IJH2_9PEZI|nr:fungal-specific transcription factor domain-containing protein [Apodospora peruviana]
MSQHPPPPAPGSLRPSPAASGSPDPSPLATGEEASAGRASKPRSCVTCRARKVRCNKANPCSNCQRAGIACVFPEPERTPRWARRLHRQQQPPLPPKPAHAAPPEEGVSQVMDRLHKLESLVKELNSQLRHESNASAPPPPGRQAHVPTLAVQVESPAKSAGSPDTGDISSSAQSVDHEFGRLVLDDASRARYVSSGFWSRVNDELDGLRMETGALAGEDSDVSEDQNDEHDDDGAERAAEERHSFLFGHNIGGSTTTTENLHPPPSYVPLLFALFTRNVNVLVQVVHMPSLVEIAQNMQQQQSSNDSKRSNANEALLFAVYYATIVSMEDEDVQNSFGSTKQALMRKYRYGLERALARADFLNVPDLKLVQAFTTFLLLVRRHESPRFVWMMTGLAIRMGQALGLHRDGAKLKNLSPFEAEIRRRVWWVLCGLDVRASEDQGTDLTIPYGGFDTAFPLNLNDSDLDAKSRQVPTERQGLTDMTFALYTFHLCLVTREMVVPPPNAPKPSLDEIERQFSEVYDTIDQKYMRLAGDLPDKSQWAGIMVLRLFLAKMSLILNLPQLFSSSVDDLPPDFRDKLFLSALEVAEINHALYSEQRCRPWRWMLQTYTQWHAIVMLLLEVSRRAWSPTVERAWAALQSRWLIPDTQSMDRSLRVWIPLRKLIAQARRHRAAELARLRRDRAAAQTLLDEDENGKMVTAPRGDPAVEEQAARFYRARWMGMVFVDETDTQGSTTGYAPVSQPVHAAATNYVNAGTGGEQQQFPGKTLRSIPGVQFQGLSNSGFAVPVNPTMDFNTVRSQSSSEANAAAAVPVNYDATARDQAMAIRNTFSQGPAPWPWADPWLWADLDSSAVDVFGGDDIQLDDNVDVNMDLSSTEIDWMDWFGSARDVETGKMPDVGN